VDQLQLTENLLIVAACPLESLVASLEYERKCHWTTQAHRAQDEGRHDRRRDVSGSQAVRVRGSGGHRAGLS